MLRKCWMKFSIKKSISEKSSEKFENLVDEISIARSACHIVAKKVAR